MTKKWIISLAVLIFILSNIASFLFAQKLAKIVAKSRQICEEKDNRQTISQVNINTDNKLTGFVSGETLKLKNSDFDDSDYLVTSENYQYSHSNEDIQRRADNVASGSNGAANSSNTPTETQRPNTTSLNAIGQSNLSGLSDSSNTTDGYESDYLADDDIPIPQLPLSDTDFEIEANDGGYEPIALPQLPEEDVNID